MNKPTTQLFEKVKPEYFFWAAALCSLLFFVHPQESALPSVASVVVATQPTKVNPYVELELLARAASVYDVKARKTLFGKNELEVLPLASITKLMTAVTALSLVPDTTYIPISSRAIREEGDSGFKVGDRWLLRDLLKFTLLESSNDGAVAVSEAIGGVIATSTQTADGNRLLFIQKMNEKAQELGLHSTYFLNEDGLDIDKDHAGAFSSASETTLMLAHALEQFPLVFEETRLNELVLSTEDGGRYSAVNTNKKTDTLPLLIASKTGYTDLSGGNLVIAFDAGFNHPVIISVLGSTRNGRYSDVEKLLWATLDALSEAN